MMLDVKTEERKYGCWTNKPMPHPWNSDVTDTPCGYDWRDKDEKCIGCYRRSENDKLMWAQLGGGPM